MTCSWQCIGLPRPARSRENGGQIATQRPRSTLHGSPCNTHGIHQARETPFHYSSHRYVHRETACQQRTRHDSCAEFERRRHLPSGPRSRRPVRSRGICCDSAERRHHSSSTALGALDGLVRSTWSSPPLRPLHCRQCLDCQQCRRRPDLRPLQEAQSLPEIPDPRHSVAGSGYDRRQLVSPQRPDFQDVTCSLADLDVCGLTRVSPQAAARQLGSAGCRRSCLAAILLQNQMTPLGQVLPLDLREVEFLLHLA